MVLNDINFQIIIRYICVFVNRIDEKKKKKKLPDNTIVVLDKFCAGPHNVSFDIYIEDTR